MPEYIYKHPDKEEYVSVIQRMNEAHVYSDEKQLEWKRVLTCPKLSIDSNIDPFDKNHYIDKTRNMKGSVGDLMDQSHELSQKRASMRDGEDPVKRKKLDDWSSKRGGMIHPKDTAKRVVENKNARIDF
jgi:hypothetical protein